MCPGVSSACPVTSGRATAAWAATAMSSSAAKVAAFAARRTFCSMTRPRRTRNAPRRTTCSVRSRAKMPWSSRMSVDAMPTSSLPMMGALHDAFEKGYRVGIVCHSDDHKGRPGATRPGASTFGAIGGLTCYLMPELTRDALFEALRKRRHYGTTGARIFLDLRASFDHAVTGFSEDPQFAPAREALVHHALMGDIIRPGGVPMRLAGEVIGTAPIERVDVLHGVQVVQTARPYGASDLGRRVRVMWQGAEYRGRGRETHWDGRLMLTGNRFSRFAPVNFLNPERRVLETTTGTALAWSSVTTGNLAGIDIWLDEASRGRLSIETNIVSGDIDLALLACDAVVLDGRGLGRQISIYRLPETDWSARVALDHTARFSGGTDLPVYLRVTQADGHQAWSSPIYLID